PAHHGERHSVDALAWLEQRGNHLEGETFVIAPTGMKNDLRLLDRPRSAERQELGIAGAHSNDLDRRRRCHEGSLLFTARRGPLVPLTRPSSTVDLSRKGRGGFASAV